MDRRGDSLYCYYHDKLMEGVTTPHISTVLAEVEDFHPETGKRRVRSERQFVTRTDCYPAWPLPKQGYVVLIDLTGVTAA